jgi:hypothetical protein
VVGEISLRTAAKLDDVRADLTHRWIRGDDLKLIVPVKEGKPELDDLARDPEVKRDLAAERPQDVARLTRLLKETWDHEDGKR